MVTTHLRRNSSLGIGYELSKIIGKIHMPSASATNCHIRASSL
jgi:hypothetical protein